MHPFSLASSPQIKDYMIFMIKRNGDWTGKLIDKLYEAKRKILKIDELGIDNYDEETIFNLLHDVDQEWLISSKEARKEYPRIHITRPISSPAESAAYRRNIILIGAGSGISPYLAFLDDREDTSKISPKVGGLPKKPTTFKKAHVVLIVRKSD